MSEKIPTTATRQPPSTPTESTPSTPSSALPSKKQSVVIVQPPRNLTASSSSSSTSIPVPTKTMLIPKPKSAVSGSTSSTQPIPAATVAGGVGPRESGGQSKETATVKSPTSEGSGAAFALPVPRSVAGGSSRPSTPSAPTTPISESAEVKKAAQQPPAKLSYAKKVAGPAREKDASSTSTTTAGPPSKKALSTTSSTFTLPAPRSKRPATPSAATSEGEIKPLSPTPATAPSSATATIMVSGLMTLPDDVLAMIVTSITNFPYLSSVCRRFDALVSAPAVLRDALKCYPHLVVPAVAATPTSPISAAPSAESSHHVDPSPPSGGSFPVPAPRSVKQKKAASASCTSTASSGSSATVATSKILLDFYKDEVLHRKWILSGGNAFIAKKMATAAAVAKKKMLRSGTDDSTTTASIPSTPTSVATPSLMSGSPTNLSSTPTSPAFPPPAPVKKHLQPTATTHITQTNTPLTAWLDDGHSHQMPTCLLFKVNDKVGLRVRNAKMSLFFLEDESAVSSGGDDAKPNNVRVSAPDHRRIQPQLTYEASGPICNVSVVMRRTIPARECPCCAVPEDLLADDGLVGVSPPTSPTVAMHHHHHPVHPCVCACPCGATNSCLVEREVVTLAVQTPWNLEMWEASYSLQPASSRHGSSTAPLQDVEPHLCLVHYTSYYVPELLQAAIETNNISSHHTSANIRGAWMKHVPLSIQGNEHVGSPSQVSMIYANQQSGKLLLASFVLHQDFYLDQARCEDAMCIVSVVPVPGTISLSSICRGGFDHVALLRFRDRVCFDSAPSFGVLVDDHNMGHVYSFAERQWIENPVNLVPFSESSTSSGDRTNETSGSNNNNNNNNGQVSYTQVVSARGDTICFALRDSTVPSHLSTCEFKCRLTFVRVVGAKTGHDHHPQRNRHHRESASEHALFPPPSLYLETVVRLPPVRGLQHYAWDDARLYLLGYKTNRTRELSVYSLESMMSMINSRAAAAATIGQLQPTTPAGNGTNRMAMLSVLPTPLRSMRVPSMVPEGIHIQSVADCTPPQGNHGAQGGSAINRGGGSTNTATGGPSATAIQSHHHVVTNSALLRERNALVNCIDTSSGEHNIFEDRVRSNFTFSVIVKGVGSSSVEFMESIIQGSAGRPVPAAAAATVSPAAVQLQHSTAASSTTSTTGSRAGSDGVQAGGHHAVAHGQPNGQMVRDNSSVFTVPSPSAASNASTGSNGEHHTTSSTSSHHEVLSLPAPLRRQSGANNAARESSVASTCSSTGTTTTTTTTSSSSPPRPSAAALINCTSTHHRLHHHLTNTGGGGGGVASHGLVGAVPPGTSSAAAATSASTSTPSTLSNSLQFSARANQPLVATCTMPADRRAAAKRTNASSSSTTSGSGSQSGNNVALSQHQHVTIPVASVVQPLQWTERVRSVSINLV